MNHVKQGLGTEVPSIMRAHRLIRKPGILIGNHNGLLAPGARRRLGEQLRLAALVHGDEPKDRLVNGVPDRQQAMVLQQRGLAPTDTGRDVAPFLGRQDDPVEGLVDGVVVVESASVLRDGFEGPAQGAKGAPVDGVAVAGGVDVRARLVDGRVDHEGGRVEQAVGSAVDDAPFLVDADQVRGGHQAEGVPERVHPKGVGLDGVAVGDVACDALVEAVLGEDAEGGGQAAFPVGSLLVWVIELGWSMGYCSLCQQLDTVWALTVILGKTLTGETWASPLWRLRRRCRARGARRRRDAGPPPRWCSYCCLREEPSCCTCLPVCGCTEKVDEVSLGDDVCRSNYRRV